MEIVEFCRLRSIRFDPFVIRISKLLPSRAGAHDSGINNFWKYGLNGSNG
jgi:hypothetical protein